MGSCQGCGWPTVVREDCRCEVCPMCGVVKCGGVKNWKVEGKVEVGKMEVISVDKATWRAVMFVLARPFLMQLDDPDSTCILEQLIAELYVGMRGENN